MKKYSDKYLNSYKILSQAILGFEFECFFKDVSFYKVLELMNKELAPVKVHGFRAYHSGFVTDANNFSLEKDMSGGINMAEIITGPLDYYSAKYYLIKILKFIDKYGYTTNKSSIHINLSFKDKNLNNLNILRQILTTDEDLIYKKFPTRKNNMYARSIKTIIPFKDYDFSNVAIGSIKNILQVPKSKYYGINFQHINNEIGQRIEFRYIGGENYEKSIGDILEIMDNMIINTYNNINSGFTDRDINQLSEFLEERINSFKNINSYDSFLVEYPNLEIQINQDPRYEVVSTHYSKIYEKIFNFLERVEDIKEGILNFFINTNKIEVVGAEFTAITDLSDYDFIKCDIYGGIFNNSNIYDCNMINCEINRSMVDGSELKDIKLISCNVKDSMLENCFFQAGLLDSHMEGGIFRSGKLGPYATFSDSTMVVGREEQNFFNTKMEDDDLESDKKNKK